MSKFRPKFSITTGIANALMRIEAAKEAVGHLPITASVLATLRETARLYSTHYSTMIEGNRLTQEQVSKVVEKQEHFPGRERDEKEVLGYYAGLEKVEELAAFTLSQRAARNLLSSWVKKGFVVVIDPAKKTRKYALAAGFKRLISDQSPP